MITTGSNGCSIVSTIDVAEVRPVRIDFTMPQNENVQLHVKEVSLSAEILNPAFPPYTFSWSNGSIGKQATYLPSDSISMVVKDSNGCATTSSP